MNEEMYHHGILGQKWGIRRFQNSDGSLTSAGKRRYDKDTSNDRSKNSKAEILEKSNKGTKNLKRAAAVGATIAVASLAVIGAKKLSQVKRATNVGSSVVNTALNSTNIGNSVVNVSRTAANVTTNRPKPKMSRQDAKRMQRLMEVSRMEANRRLSVYGNHYFG